MHPTPVHVLFATAARRGDAPALRHRVDGAWVETSWKGYAEGVRRVARAFLALGLQKGGAVAIIGPNRPEWVLAAWGAVAAGGAPAGVYATLPADQAAYVVRHAEATIAVVHDDRQLAKLRAERANLPHLRHIVRMVGGTDAEAMSWADFCAKGDAVSDAALDERLAAIEPGDLCSLIYTSGTTGNPKAVMITGRNLLAAANGYAVALPRISESDQLLSYLPLCHIAEQLLSLWGPAHWGYCVSFCEELEQLAVHLREVRPTVFFAVPRVWEKFESRIREAGAAGSPLQRKLGTWAKAVALRANQARMRGEPTPWTYPLAERLLAKAHARIGLDRAWLCASGAAKLNAATHEYFLSLDLPIVEVYGMSENTALATLNRVDAMRTGTVGLVAPSTELRIADDGEILTRGAQVFAGYLKDEAATREAIDDDGWLHTGDVGELDGDGFVRITDRKKDLFKTSGGKYIAPTHLEGKLAGIAGIAQVVAIGDGRNYVTALFALDPEGAPKIAETLGVAGRTVPDIATDPKFVAWVEGEVAKVNESLARYETIKRVRVLPHVFSVDGGELTPTLKLKRKAVVKKYATEIEGLYVGD